MNPFQLFKTVFEEAKSAGQIEVDAVALSTSDSNNNPTSRIVYIKSFDEQGFPFYTNFKSRKGKEIAQNPKGCILYFWPATGRQVRIEGKIEKLTDLISDQYWNTRPPGSQIGGMVSPQSSVISGIDELKKEKQILEKKYKDQIIPRPTHWGGYLLVPSYFEFWKSGVDRLHERTVFEKKPNSTWKKYFIAP